MAKVKQVLGIIVIVALLIGSSAPCLVSMTPVAAQGDESESFSPELAEQLAEIYQQKQALTPVQRKIDWSILQVIREAEERASAAYPGEALKLRNLSTPLLKMDDTGNIEVKLTVTSLTAEQLEQLEALGMQIGLTLPEYGVVEGSLPYDQVEAVAELDFVVNVGTPGYAVQDTGAVTSEGDTVLRAAEARAAFGVDGSGIKVGVISDGVNNLAASVATGDLPSSPAVDVLQAGDGDEGTAMLEIVHDLAPGAPLAFYSPSTSSYMVAGIGDLETAGCDVIVDDLTFFDEPKFEDGPIAQEARAFYTGGGVYVTSAGNSAQSHYMGTYVRSAGSPGLGYAYAHVYAGTDIRNTFTIPNGGAIITVLHWNNQWGLSGDDFDLFLARSADGVTLENSINYQEGYGDPWEKLSWTNTTGSSVSVFIAVVEWSLVSSPSSLILDYNVYDNWPGAPGLEYVVPENSLIGHAAVEEVLSTAAAYWGTPSTIESFSSRGPGTIYFPSHEERQLPNITGVDGVQTTGPGSFPSVFYGTSAAAPHVAAIAALVWEANPALTPAQVKQAIESTAVDKGTAGYDNTWGWGLADAYEAVSSVSALGEPDITVSPTSFDVTLPTNTTQSYTLTIGNDGGADLTYDISDRETTSSQAQTVIESTPTVAPGIDAYGNEAVDKSQSHKMVVPQGVGDAIKSFPSPGSGPLGLAWDGQYLWNVDWATNMIYKLSPSTGSVVQSFSSPGTRPFGLTYDGTYLWVADRDDNKIYQLDPATGSVIRSIPSPGTNPEGLTWDGNYLWVAEWYDNKIYKLDPSDGSIIQSFDWVGTYTCGLAWDGTYLWHCDPGFDTIYKLNPTDGSVITSFSSPSTWPAGLTWDGQYIWNSDSGQDIIYQIDVGAPEEECPWLDESPTSGTVGAGSSDSILVTIDTTGLAEGSYSAEIVIASNDADEASTTVPVTLQVSAVTVTLESISASPTSVSLGVGGTQQLTITATYSDASTADVTATSSYASSDTSVATVSTGGLITGVAAGSATITVTYDTKTTTVPVTVTIGVVLESIAASPTSVSLAVGATQQLTITATYSDASTADVTATSTYASSDTSVATVSTGGLITAVAAGSATITVTYDTKTTTVAVTVTAPAGASVSIDPATQIVSVGGTFTIDVLIDAGTYSLRGCDVALSYDSSAMSTSTAQITAHNLLSGMEIGPTVTDGEVSYAIAAATAVPGVSASVMAIEFTVSDTASPGTYNLTITRADLNDENNVPVPGVVTNDGTVTVRFVMKGDFDGDGDIDLTDFVSFVAAYGSSAGDPDYNAIGDFDDDGDIDLTDFVAFVTVYAT